MIFCPLVHMSINYLVFVTSSFKIELTSQLLIQTISIDALWMLIILLVLNTYKYVFQYSFYNCIDDLNRRIIYFDNLNRRIIYFEMVRKDNLYLL
jgi:hypothetical protein